MKILILGGTSFFGKEFALTAFRGGHNITIFSNKCPIDKIPLDIKQVRGDRNIYVDLARMSVETWDVILDNICYTPQDAENAVKAFSKRCGLYVFTSSEAVYSVLERASSPYREKSTSFFSENAGLRGLSGYEYAFGKLDSEKVFLKAFAEKKFPAVIIRFPIIIGPHDPTLRAFSYWIRLADERPLISPGAFFKRRYIYSKDAAASLDVLISSPGVAGEIFNFADDVEITLYDFLKLSANIMGKKVEILSPDFSWLQENGFDFESSPFSYYSDFVIDIRKAREKLNWKSSDINDWLKETINWFFFKYMGPAPKNYRRRKEEIALMDKIKSHQKMQ